MTLEAPSSSVLPGSSLEFTHHGSQLFQECEQGGDEVCGILRPDGPITAEPEHPAGKLGQPGGSGLRLEPGLLAPVPPAELTCSLSLAPQTAQLREEPRCCVHEGLRTVPAEKLTGGSQDEALPRGDLPSPTRYTHKRKSFPRDISIDGKSSERPPQAWLLGRPKFLLLALGKAGL